MKLLPQKHGSLGLAAFVDFYELEAAKEAHNDDIKLKVIPFGCYKAHVYRF